MSIALTHDLIPYLPIHPQNTALNYRQKHTTFHIPTGLLWVIELFYLEFKC